jgi:hypothetical protein
VALTGCLSGPDDRAAAAVLVGAGDIAYCGPDEAATAQLLDSIGGTVFTAGDNAYVDGTALEFQTCYEPSWGRHKARTRPAPGNHDYNTPGATGYYAYFGDRAGASGVGYYSYPLGDWHVISLNSNIDMSSGSAQEQWLRAELAAHPARCVLAYWHHPRFSSGLHGSDAASQPLWQALYDANADVVIAGHDHTYERFAPQTPLGDADDARGIRQFVAGTGGAGLYDFRVIAPNSEFRQNTAHGVLKLMLAPDGYSWEFISTARDVLDAGSSACH